MSATVATGSSHTTFPTVNFGSADASQSSTSISKPDAGQASNGLNESDFATLLQLFSPSLPRDHPGIQYLEATPRRNFTATIRSQLSLSSFAANDELLKHRKLFDLVQSLFKGDPSALIDNGMKLQLNERVDQSKQGVEEDIRNTFLGLILTCLNQYPWFSKRDRFLGTATLLPLSAADSGDEMITLGLIIRGIQHNLNKYGFGYPTQSINQLDSLNRSTDAVGPDRMSILSLCILQFGRSPLSSLIQPMIELFQILIRTTAARVPNQTITSASAISLTSTPTTISTSVESNSDLRTSLHLAFLRLFQQNPNMTKELLPFIRLFRQHGIKPNEVMQKFNHLGTDSSMASDADDDRPINMWVYMSQWVTLDKIEFLLRWLLEEPNLGELYDPNYRLDWGDGRGEQTILSYITHLKDQHPHHTALQFYHQILVHLSTVLTHSSNGTSTWSDPHPSLTSSTSTVSSSSLSSLSSSVISTTRVVDQSSFRSWLEDGLQHITDSSRGCVSARLLERLTAPFLLTSNNSRFYVGKSTSPELTPIQKASLNEAVSGLLVVLREHPDELNLLEEDAFGNTLFHTILALPTYELIRLKSVEKQFLSKIDSLPSTIMSDFRRVLGSESNPIVNELFTEIVLFNKAIAPTVTPVSNFLIGHKIYPIFHPDTIRLEVTGIQFFHPTGATHVPVLQLWDCQSQTVLATADTSRMVPIPNDYNVAEFDQPIILTEAQAMTGVLASGYFNRNSVRGSLPVASSVSCVNPHEDYRLDTNAYYSGDLSFPTTPNRATYFLFAPVTRKIYSTNAAPKAFASSSSVKLANADSFLSLYSNQPDHTTQSLWKGQSCEIGTLIQFHSAGSVHGLRIYFGLDVEEVPSSKYQYQLRLWNYTNKQLLGSTHVVHMNGSKVSWLVGMFQESIPVQKDGRYTISFGANPGGVFMPAPPPIPRPEFTILGSLYHPQPGSYPTLGSLASFVLSEPVKSNIDLLFVPNPPTTTPTPTKPPMKATEPFVFTLPDRMTVPSTSTDSTTPFKFVIPNFSNPFEPIKPKDDRQANVSSAASSSTTTIGSDIVVSMDKSSPPPKREYTKLTPESLHGNALPTYQVNAQGQIIRVSGNSTSAPLDLLFTRHSPYPTGEFIYQLFDRLLTKAIPYHLTELELSSLIESSSVGNLVHVMTQFSKMEMNELRVWLDLFDRHSIRSIQSSVPVSIDPFDTWLKSCDLTRIREWCMVNESTDALWPKRTRSGGDSTQPQESLLDTAKRLSGDSTFISQNQNRVNMQSIIKYLEHQRDQWYQLYLPLIRVNVTEQIIQDLSNIVCDYLILSPLTSPTVSSSVVAPSTIVESTSWTSDHPPKKPLTAYILFSNAKREQVKIDNPGIAFGEVAKVISNLWKSSNDFEKEPYNRLALQDRERYEREMMLYNARKKRTQRPEESSDSSSPSDEDDD